ncbi:MAG: hypothetical protein N2645_23860 [Clostridia bacterium]|nr:hypothetical protein [Clostridia bacterium]
MVFVYQYDLSMKKEQNRQSMSQEDKLKEFDGVVSKVDDTAIIKKALKSVGILTLLEGVERYKQTLEEETWYSYRGINIDWHYRFAIAVNLEDLVIETNGKKVDIGVDKKKLYVQFVEKTRESISHSEASILAKKFSSQEISALEKAIVKKVGDKILSTGSYWDDALKSLETNLRKMCNQLGYYEINFIEKDS